MTGVTNFGDIVTSPMYECDLPDSRSESKMRHSDWCGELIAPQNGRIRFVGITERVATALASSGILRSRRVLCKDDGTPLTRQGAWS